MTRPDHPRNYPIAVGDLNNLVKIDKNTQNIYGSAESYVSLYQSYLDTFKNRLQACINNNILVYYKTRQLSFP
jgi:hypothetical protein